MLVVSRKGKNNTHISLSPFALENFVSRDGFGSVPSRPALSIAVRFLTCHHELDVLHQFIMWELNQSSKHAET